MKNRRQEDIESLDWVERVPEQNREKVRESFLKAGTLKDKVRLLARWHPKGYATLRPIRNLEEYFRYVKASTTDWTWFRGETRDFGRLVPRLYRGCKTGNIAEQKENERLYFLEFQRRARPFAPDVALNDTWAWYFLIQHYGGPTRLLDWSEDAAIALFFAVGTDQGDTRNSIVTCLEPAALLDYAFREVGGKATNAGRVLYPGERPTERWIGNIGEQDGQPIRSLPISPIALLPPHLNPRITAQRSCFTLFGNKADGFHKNGKQIVCPCCGGPIFSRLVIDGKSRNDLRKELAKIGVTSGRVYPGLEGLCRELSQEIYTENPRLRAARQQLRLASSTGQPHSTE